MNREDLQKLTEERIKDAESLLAGGRWELAYYVAGYAVECALKSSMLARMVLTGWIFDEKVKQINDCRTHDFERLIQIAGLNDELITTLRASAAGSQEFADNWETAKLWDVTSRYEFKSEAEARELYAAITDDPHGVLRWIQKFW